MATSKNFVIRICSLCILVVLFYFVLKVPNWSLHSDDVVRIVHQSWKVHQLPYRFDQWRRSWNETCYPNWIHILWNDKENRQLIANEFPWFLSTYDGFPKNIMRADCARYFYLFKYGGIYTDLDTECVKPFDFLLRGEDIVLGAMEGQFGDIQLKEGYIQNSFMYSKPGQFFWLELLHRIMKTKNTAVEWQTGPIVLMKAISDYQKRYPDRIKIYPPSYFNPYSWIYLEKAPPGCTDLNKMTDEELKKCQSYFQNSFIIQYHVESWHRGKVF